MICISRDITDLLVSCLEDILCTDVHPVQYTWYIGMCPFLIVKLNCLEKQRTYGPKYQGRPLRVHEYTFVSLWFLKAYICIEKLGSRVFQWYMTLLYIAPYSHVIYRWNVLERSLSMLMLKIMSPQF